jgi:hypothetical protein
MIEQSFYLSDPNNIEYASDITGLSLDEIEYIVGRFRKNSIRAGMLKGKVVVYINGSVSIRASFGNKLLWTKD